MMVRSFFGLFGDSPFPYLTEMAHKVRECVDEVPKLFDAFLDGDYDRVLSLAEKISDLEHEVDVVKTRIRDSMPKSRFMPVDRRDMLEVLATLDAVADAAEDVAELFSLREMEPHEELIDPLKSLVRRVDRAVDQAVAVVEALEVVAEMGFTGKEADRVMEMIDELNRLEHKADLAQDEVTRQLFAIEDEIKPASLCMWCKIFNELGDIANSAERMGNRLRLFLSK